MRKQQTHSGKGTRPDSTQAFSLVEVLAAIAIIGIITFLAIPNLIRVKQDGEQNLAIARAQSLNLAMASYVQAVGSSVASSSWPTNDQSAYTLIVPYASFAPTNLTSFLPAGYLATIPDSVSPLTNVTLTGPSGVITY